MGSRNISYPEKLLHWIWKEQHFDFHKLHTTGGNKIQVLNPGKINKSDGPDFKSAKITIGQLHWYGDVEIHWRLRDWKSHGHHRNPDFNNVVLHVVFEETELKSLREDNTPIPTLCLSPHLSKPLQQFLGRFQQQARLPCAGQLSFISEKAFAEQLDKAHKEYFEKKVDDILKFYDPSLRPSKAWTKMFTIAFFDGLGIAHNRTPMQKLAAKLTEKVEHLSSQEELSEQALLLSGFNKRHPRPDIKWKRKGCRPGNHPLNRVKQGAKALWHIHQLPFEQWMRGNPGRLWQNLIESIDVKPTLGQERASILYGTVFLPAIYSLGNLFFSQKLKTRSWELWHNHSARIPSSLLKMLKHTDLSSALYEKKLGTIYQLRSYCRPRNCRDCEVFKSAISS